MSSTIYVDRTPQLPVVEDRAELTPEDRQAARKADEITGPDAMTWLGLSADDFERFLVIAGIRAQQFTFTGYNHPVRTAVYSRAALAAAAADLRALVARFPKSLK